MRHPKHGTDHTIGWNSGNPYPCAESRHCSVLKGRDVRKPSPPPEMVAGFSYGAVESAQYPPDPLPGQRDHRDDSRRNGKQPEKQLAVAWPQRACRQMSGARAKDLTKVAFSWVVGFGQWQVAHDISQ